ncbi:hypothetical protein GCM10009682_22930 [Luedemannella flava]|uniref:Uncharacterized protein n=1 Tax=Luedemannella flava TaxID=349316 RepID=A0ABP4Y905_9ACTN
MLTDPRIHVPGDRVLRGHEAVVPPALAGVSACHRAPFPGAARRVTCRLYFADRRSVTGPDGWRGRAAVPRLGDVRLGKGHLGWCTGC